MAIRVLEETGLLPHLNPGVLSWQDFQRLKPVAPSMGMMLETTASRLFSTKGAPHFGSPDKDPAVRLRVLEDAGPQQRPVHHRHPDRHRRDPGRARRVGLRDP
jgi:FO synthase